MSQIYQSRCNFSLISNYVLYLVFITTTIFYVYFAVRPQDPCYANSLSNFKVSKGIGVDVQSRFQVVFVIGSICGILEIMRNTINLWAKCFNYQRLAVLFQVLGFITAFLFLLNFILMQLYRFTHYGKVCSGDYLEGSEEENSNYSMASANQDYLIMQGYFIKIMIIIHYSMFALITLTILFVAATLKYK